MSEEHPLDERPERAGASSCVQIVASGVWCRRPAAGEETARRSPSRVARRAPLKGRTSTMAPTSSVQVAATICSPSSGSCLSLCSR